MELHKPTSPSHPPRSTQPSTQPPHPATQPGMLPSLSLSVPAKIFNVRRCLYRDLVQGFLEAVSFALQTHPPAHAPCSRPPIPSLQGRGEHKNPINRMDGWTGLMDGMDGWMGLMDGMDGWDGMGWGGWDGWDGWDGRDGWMDGMDGWD